MEQNTKKRQLTETKRQQKHRKEQKDNTKTPKGEPREIDLRNIFKKIRSFLLQLDD